MNLLLKCFLLIIAVLSRPASYAQQVPVQRSGLVGNSIAVFIPTGFDSSQTPSLMLQGHPSIRGAVPARWSIIPEFFLTGGRAGARVRLKGDISLYGGGEVTGPLLRNGQTIKLWNTDNGAYGTDSGRRLYQTHPWVLGVREDGTAFGILFDSPWKAELTTSPDKVEFNTEGALFRVFVIDRRSPQQVLEGLAELTGTIEMPPRWALGYHQCRFSYAPERRVKEIADTFRQKKIPCDAIWMDIDYMEGYRVFTFNKTGFPDPKRLNDYLHAKGFHSVFMIDPGVKADSTYFVYQSGTAKDVWVKDTAGKEYHGKVWPGDCTFPDFTMPRTRQWWAGLYRGFLANGMDGIWNDMNEPAVNDNELPPNLRLGTMPYNTPHRGGGSLPAGPHLLYHNAYGRLMVQATRQGVMAARPGKRPFILTRANLLGGQRYAATWTGDNLADEKFMKVSVPMSLTLGLSGQPFSGPDIGGFLGNTTPGLWARWLGFGVFLPFARGHACAGTNNKEPWAFGADIEKTSKIAIERRYRLLPYLYTLFYKAHKTGLPLMCPVFFDDPKNLRLRAEDQVFLLGKDLLVVPSFARDPELPEGIWAPLSLVNGDQSDSSQAKLFIKGGSIIPAGKIIQHTGERSIDELTLFICPDSKGRASGVLYWDAGEGWGFKNGDYCLLRFQATEKRGCIQIHLASRQGRYNINKDIRQVKAVVVKKGRTCSGLINLENGLLRTDCSPE
ncbi:alpha-glucosidase [Niabella ginsenosidivorans]|uniref:Alpha-glucosidase n=1 Tax=Niabella ginsenosidivorans TaxID=1176587 RepID=A0A1A9I865_9BACT|nr:TIM-barrel domain-containing protein [Niabella ginsenosidivorans]ANH83773.1 alpha-glucosidase [Niabella ginsenosidivorans]